jgi:adenylate kinase family enzyme
VDGRGAAGKTTFAARLAAALDGAPVVHTDDVVARVGHPWWPTLEEQVLAPLAAGGPDVLIIEGVSSSRRAIADRLAYAIWLHVPTGPRLARAIERDGPAAAADWAGYEAEENAFFAADPAPDRADLVVDGASALPHAATTEYVRLR